MPSFTIAKNSTRMKNQQKDGRFTGGGGEFNEFPIYSERGLSKHAISNPFSVDWNTHMSESAFHHAGVAPESFHFPALRTLQQNPLEEPWIIEFQQRKNKWTTSNLNI